MNSIQPNIPTPPPPAQPSQIKTDAGDPSGAAPSKAFAAAMDHASAKPTKKTAAGKTANGDAGGKPLPVAGNQAPSAAAVSAQTTPGKPVLLTVADSIATSAQPVTANATLPAPSGPAGSEANAPDGSNTVQGDDMAVGGALAVCDDTAATTAATAPAEADALSDPTAAGPDSPTGPAVSQAGSPQLGGAQPSAVQSATNGDGVVQGVAAQAGAAPASAAQASPAQAGGAKSGVAAATASIAVAAKLPVGSITGNARVATVKSDVVGTNGANPATTTTTTTTIAQSDLSAVAASNDAGSVQTGADAGTTAMAAATSGIATQNAVSSTDSAASAATGTPIGADAATVADATASATAAVAASAARVITQLASTTATDKRSRGGDAVSGAASTTGADGTSGAAQAMSGVSSTSNTDAVASPVFKVGPGVDSSEFGQSVVNQVATMLGSNISSAKLSVNPPSLGPIEVRIAVQGDQAQISMMSHSAVTRDALHDSSPKLREMLNSQGFAQVSVDISQRSFQERTPTPQTYDWNSGSDRSEHSSATTAATPVTRSASGTLDAYA